jgi:acyl-CoA thioesterase-1
MIVAVAAVVLLASCRRDGVRAPVSGVGSVAESSAAAPQAVRASPDTGHRAPDTRLVIFLGTSLTAGLGLDPDQAYPAVIQRKLDSLRLPWRAVNAGVSGETSAGALRRLGWLLRDRPAVLVLETGANDMLRGENLDSTRANLAAIVRRAATADPGLTIVLAGMEAAPNLGPRYAAQFRALFRDLAAHEHLPLIPFLLQGVGGVDSLNQADGIHPTAAGQRIVADNAWRVLEPLLAARGGARARGGTEARAHGRTVGHGQQGRGP